MTPAEQGPTPRASRGAVPRAGRLVRRLGSPLYEHLLDRAADDLEAGGPVWRASSRTRTSPLNFAHHLRLMGATHRLALAARRPSWRRTTRRPAATATPTAAWPRSRSCSTSATDHARPRRCRPTRSAARRRCSAASSRSPTRDRPRAARCWSSARAPGSTCAGTASATRRPTGRSATRRRRARGPRRVRGRRARRCRATSGWSSAPAATRTRSTPTTRRRRLTLQSFVWPDQTERLELLRGAIEVARRTPAPVDRADAADWLEERLARERGGAATVVYHSVIWGYLTERRPGADHGAMHEAGDARRPTPSRSRGCAWSPAPTRPT